MAKHAPAAPRLPAWRRPAAVALVVASAYAFARAPFILHHGASNGTFSFTRYPLLEDPVEHPRLRLLRAREKLDQVVAPGKSEFEKMLLLRRWARKQWEPAQTFRYPPWDAVEILDLARRRKNYGFCAQYSIVFLQACRALGWHARYVDLGHFLTAVWSNDHDRWVIMDPTNDLHYERDGRPMAGRELSDAAWKDRTRGIEKVYGDGTRKAATPEDMQDWRKYSILFNNNQLTRPIRIGDPRGGPHYELTHQDDYLRYPMIGRDAIGYEAATLVWRPAGRPSLWEGRAESDDADDFRGRYNQTFIMPVNSDAARGIAKLKLIYDSAPAFETFLVRINAATAYTESKSEVQFELKPGENVLYARVRTKYGWLGPESSLSLYYKPDWLKKL